MRILAEIIRSKWQGKGYPLCMFCVNGFNNNVKFWFCSSALYILVCCLFHSWQLKFIKPTLKKRDSEWNEGTIQWDKSDADFPDFGFRPFLLTDKHILWNQCERENFSSW